TLERGRLSARVCRDVFLVVVLSVLVVAEDSADLTAGPQARVDVDVCDMAADSLDQRRELAGSDNQSSMPRHGPSFQALEGNGSSRLPREPGGHKTRGGRLVTRPRRARPTAPRVNPVPAARGTRVCKALQPMPVTLISGGTLAWTSSAGSSSRRGARPESR